MTLLGRDKNKEANRSAVLANLVLANDALDNILKESHSPNILLHDILRAVEAQNKSFDVMLVSIKNLLATEESLRAKAAAERARREAEFDMTKDDMRY